MSEADLLSGIEREAPVQLEPVGMSGAIGLVIVDEVNGFATVGGGNLAPIGPNAQVAGMVAETDALARAFAARDLPLAAFLDTHEPGKPEPPYPSSPGLAIARRQP